MTIATRDAIIHRADTEIAAIAENNFWKSNPECRLVIGWLPVTATHRTHLSPEGINHIPFNQPNPRTNDSVRVVNNVQQQYSSIGSRGY